MSVADLHTPVLAQPPVVKLLLVEDDPADARRLEALLEAAPSASFSISSVRCFEDAMRILKDELFDVVLLDLTLPDTDGIDTVRRARVAASSIPIIAMTNEEDEGLSLQALRFGAQDYLVKGRAVSQTAVRSIQHALERHRLLTELALARKREHYLANHDALTGLPNRAHFQDHLNRAISYAQRNGAQLALLFIDLDRFKGINDSIGHAAGDELLVQVAGRLSSSIRKSDLVARLGGDEFVVMIQDVRRDHDPATVARKILAALVSPFVLQAGEFWISASLGIAAFPRDGKDADSLMRNADAAMYEAKAHGSGRYHFYADHINVRMTEWVRLENDLRGAVGRREMRLDFESQVDAGEARVVGARALIRWCHPQRGLVPPSTFLAVAEETGAILPIAEWALRSACHEATHWACQPQGRIRISLPVSSRQIADKEFPAMVAGILRETGLEGRRLELEIGEGAVKEQKGLMLATLVQLRKLGVRIMMGGFGAGSASLMDLQRYPIDGFRIGRSLLSGMCTDRARQAIVSSLAHVARELGLAIAAEEVATREQRDLLLGRGCREQQGPLFGTPLPAERFREGPWRLDERVA